MVLLLWRLPQRSSYVSISLGLPLHSSIWAKAFWLFRMSLLPCSFGWFPSLFFVYPLFYGLRGRTLLGVIHIRFFLYGNSRYVTQITMLKYISSNATTSPSLVRTLKGSPETPFSSVTQFWENKADYFVPVNYFTIDLGSFRTPRDLASTLPFDSYLSNGSYPLSIFRARRELNCRVVTFFNTNPRPALRVRSALLQAISPLIAYDEKKVHSTLTISIFARGITGLACELIPISPMHRQLHIPICLKVGDAIQPSARTGGI